MITNAREIAISIVTQMCVGIGQKVGFDRNTFLEDAITNALQDASDTRDRPRYFLDTDNDGHWHIVPIARGGEWHVWLAIPSDDEVSWTVPEWAKSVGGSQTLVTFEDPEITE